MKLGVVHKCKYMYRRRSAGEASLIQTAKKKYGWYFDYFTYLVDWAIEFYQDIFLLFSNMNYCAIYSGGLARFMI